MPTAPATLPARRIRLPRLVKRAAEWSLYLLLTLVLTDLSLS